MDFDAHGGVQRAWRAWRPASGPPDCVLVATDERGMSNALRVRQSLRRVGAPQAIFIAPKASVCEIPGAAPCGYSTLFDFCGAGFCQIMRLRQHLMARFFLAGANVLQLDSDVAMFGDPFIVFHGTLANASLISQRDGPVANSGFFFAQHVSPAADAVTSWLLVELSDRMNWAALDASGGRMRSKCPNDQAMLNDLLQEAAVGSPRYGLGILIPELRERQGIAPPGRSPGWAERQELARAESERRPRRRAGHESDVAHQLLRSYLRHDEWDKQVQPRMSNLLRRDFKARHHPVSLQETVECAVPAAGGGGGGGDNAAPGGARRRPRRRQKGHLFWGFSLAPPSPQRNESDDPLSDVAGDGALRMLLRRGAGPQEAAARLPAVPWLRNPLPRAALEYAHRGGGGGGRGGRGFTGRGTRGGASNETAVRRLSESGGGGGKRDGGRGKFNIYLAPTRRPAAVLAEAARLAGRYGDAAVAQYAQLPLSFLQDWGHQLLRQARRGCEPPAADAASCRANSGASPGAAYGMHLAGLGAKPLRGLVLEALQPRCAASLAGGARTVRLPPAAWSEAMRARPAEFEATVALLLEVAVAAGRRLQLPRVPAHGVPWAFEPWLPNSREPHAVSMGCAAPLQRGPDAPPPDATWIPFALSGDGCEASRYLFQAAERSGTAGRLIGGGGGAAGAAGPEGWLIDAADGCAARSSATLRFDARAPDWVTALAWAVGNASLAPGGHEAATWEVAADGGLEAARVRFFGNATTDGRRNGATPGLRLRAHGGSKCSWCEAWRQAERGDGGRSRAQRAVEVAAHCREEQVQASFHMRA